MPIVYSRGEDYEHVLIKAERGEELLAAENAEDLFKKLGI